MKLSKRLELVASFVPEGSNLADIGTDHGYIPIALVSRGVAGSAIAMDVRSGPLERAEENIRRYGLGGMIITRLSDGVQQLERGEADTVVIAGMGGELVIHILEHGRHLWDSVSRWVLSPQSELDKVRCYLAKQGFAIAKEAMVCEDGKYYTVMEVKRGEMEPMSPAEFRYGRHLIKDKDPVLSAYLVWERQLLERIIQQLEAGDSQTADERIKTLYEQLHWAKEAQDEMQ